MVPDGADHCHDLRQIVSMAHSWNGNSSGWCLRCATRLLKLGDVETEIKRIQDREKAARVARLSAEGERAEKNPSKTPCQDCDGTAGYLLGWSAILGGGSYRLVMCPRCGWQGWEKVSDVGLQIVS